MSGQKQVSNLHRDVISSTKPLETRDSSQGLHPPLPQKSWEPGSLEARVPLGPSTCGYHKYWLQERGLNFWAVKNSRGAPCFEKKPQEKPSAHPSLPPSRGTDWRRPRAL